MPLKVLIHLPDSHSTTSKNKEILETQEKSPKVSNTFALFIVNQTFS